MDVIKVGGTVLGRKWKQRPVLFPIILSPGGHDTDTAAPMLDFGKSFSPRNNTEFHGEEPAKVQGLSSEVTDQVAVKFSIIIWLDSS